MKSWFREIPVVNRIVIVLLVLVLIVSGFATTGVSGGVYIGIVVLVCAAGGVALGSRIRRTRPPD